MGAMGKSKFYDRLVTGDGTTSKKVESKKGFALMEAMGWKKGKGLGKDSNGITEVIQVKRLAEDLGLGHVTETEKNAKATQGNWWSDSYNDSAMNIEIKAKKKNLIR